MRFGLALASSLLVLVAACTSSGPATPPSTSSSAPPASTNAPGAPARPNIVFVLTDDLSRNLVPYMPHVQALGEAGMTFTNFSVTDSLCCPSRASIFTGKYPHNTHVFTNIPPLGGLLTFNKYGGPRASYSYALQQAGYRTALMGKYLNNYLVGKKLGSLPENYRPEGWSTWDVGAGAYKNFKYKLNQDGAIKSYGSNPEDYLTRVITKLGVDFIAKSSADRAPFALELATYSPHEPYTPDPMDANAFPGLKAPRDASFNKLPTNPPLWLGQGRKPLTAKQITGLDTAFRKRVESVQSVDRSIGELQAALRKAGQLKNTVFVFSSDNGLHLGEHMLAAGKRTAFDTDVHTPLVVAGPGIPAGSTSTAMVENIDLAPTFAQLAGTTMPNADGRSIVPLLRDANSDRTVAWRTRALVEDKGTTVEKADPDAQPRAAGQPSTYNSLRGPSWTYVRYLSGEREYYDHTLDPLEMDNIAPDLLRSASGRARIAELDRQLTTMTRCVGPAQCWAAGRPQK